MNATPISKKKLALQRDQLVAICVLVGVNALWGLSFPIIKAMNLQMEHALGQVSGAIDPWTRVSFTAGMIGLRFAAAFIFLCFVGRSLISNASRQEWIAGAWVGLFFYVGLVLQVLGLASIPASRSGFLTSLTAVFTPLFSALLLRRLPRANVLAGVCIATLGVSLLTGLIHWNGHSFHIAPDALDQWTIGDSLTTLGSVLFTGQLLLVDYFGRRVNSVAITPGMFLSVTICALSTWFLLSLGSPWNRPLQLDGNPYSPWPIFATPLFSSLIVFLAIFCSVLAFVGMNRYQPKISAVQASIIYSTEPVFAFVWALFVPQLFLMLSSKYAFPNEQWTSELWIGGSLVLLANVVALWPRSDRSS
jgi:drug/metabolite transporter (DMT)-like permease